MGVSEHSLASLRFSGDDLIPETLSALLGASPTASCRKGDELVGRKTGQVRIARTGRWSLASTRREPEDLEAQIFEILDPLSQDLAVWKSLSRYAPDIFCGVFMASSNDGLTLSPKALLALGLRGIVLNLDIYDAGDLKAGVEAGAPSDPATAEQARSTHGE